MTLPTQIQNSSFHPTVPGLQVAWDSTSIGLLKECPRKYYYSIICGYSARQLSVHLKFGQVYHSALEAYDHAKSQGADHEQAMRMAVRRALADTWEPELHRPWMSDNPNKNRMTLVRSVVWYLDQFNPDPVETVQLKNGKPAVELSFRFETSIRGPDNSPFWLCGHLDRLVRFQDELWVLDRKTTSSTISPDFFERFSPNNQFTLYSLAANIVWTMPVRGIIVDGAQIAVTFSRFQRGLVNRHESQLEEWYDALGEYLGMAVQYAERKSWPMNETACQNYGGCTFRPICSKAPSVREQWLRSAYSHRVWDPLQVRGDI